MTSEILIINVTLFLIKKFMFTTVAWNILVSTKKKDLKDFKKRFQCFSSFERLLNN